MDPFVKLTAIVEASSDSSLANLEDVEEFLAALSREIGVSVAVVAGTLGDAPADGFVLVFEEGGLRDHPQLCPRTILINADRSSVPWILEELQLCAAVEKHRYSRWRTQRAEEFGGQLFGRKDVGARLGATFNSGYAETEHYGLMACDRYRDLPGLLAGYLVEYAGHRSGQEIVP